MEKNVASKWTVFAYGAPDHATLAGLPITGDAANITANIRIDGGAANAVDDTNPAELEDGYYIFDITATENNGDQLTLAPASSTADVIVIGVPGSLYTRPPNFNAMGIESDGDLTKVNLLGGNTPQTADHTAAIAAIPTTAMRGTDSAALASVCTEPRLAELDAANIPADIDAIPTTAMRGTDSAALASVCTEPRLAELDAANMPADIDAIPTTAMRGTDGVDTATMRGTDGANTTTPPTAVQNRQEMDSNSTQLASIKLDTGTNLPNLIDDLAIKKNTAFPNFEFLMVLASDHATPGTGLTVTAQRSIDGAAFTGVTGTIAEVSNGIYQFDAVAADTNGDVITWRFSAATADDTFVTFKTVA